METIDLTAYKALSVELIFQAIHDLQVGYDKTKPISQQEYEVRTAYWFLIVGNKSLSDPYAFHYLAGISDPKRHPPSLQTLLSVKLPFLSPGPRPQVDNVNATNFFYLPIHD